MFSPLGGFELRYFLLVLNLLVGFVGIGTFAEKGKKVIVIRDFKSNLGLELTSIPPTRSILGAEQTLLPFRPVQSHKHITVVV